MTQLSDKLVESELQKIANLEYDWDFYAAPATNPAAVAAAREKYIPEFSEKLGRNPRNIGPVSGGLYVVWFGISWKATIYINSAGNLVHFEVELTKHYVTDDLNGIDIDSVLGFLRTHQMSYNLIENHIWEASANG